MIPVREAVTGLSMLLYFICLFILGLYHLHLITGLGRSPGKGNGNPLQYSCLENSMDRGRKSRTRLNDFTFTFHFHALEKEMATHSSVLAWRISGMGETGGLPSMGSDTTEAT